MRTSYNVLTQVYIVRYSQLHTNAIWYSLLLLGYKPVQHVTVLSTLGNCKTVVSIIIYFFPVTLRPKAGHGLLAGLPNGDTGGLSGV